MLDGTAKIRKYAKELKKGHTAVPRGMHHRISDKKVAIRRDILPMPKEGCPMIHDTEPRDGQGWTELGTTGLSWSASSNRCPADHVLAVSKAVGCLFVSFVCLLAGTVIEGLLSIRRAVLW